MVSTMKHWMAADLKSRLEGSPEFLVVGLKPLDSEKTYLLRRTLRSQGARLRVIHNRTARHALPASQQGLASTFKGQTALALGTGEMIPVARAVMQAVREESLEVRGGYVEGEVLDAEGVKALALSPDKQTLRAMLCGAILAPGRGLAAALAAVAAGTARCLQARADKGGETVS